MMDAEIDANAPSPKQRICRTAIQVAVSVLLAVPAAWGALAAAGVEVDPRVTAWVVGIPAFLTVLISAGQNGIEARRDQH